MNRRSMDTTRFKELEAQYAQTREEQARIDMMVEMGMEVRAYDLERATRLADQIIEQAQAAGYQLGQGRGLNLRGWCYWQQGLYEQGLEVLAIALNIAQDLKNKALEARVLNNFGNIYRDRGELSRALSYFEKALAINEDMGDKVASATIYSSIAAVHYDLYDYDNALEYALRGIPVFEAANDVYRLTQLYYILGNIYFKQEAYARSLQYFEDILRLAEPDTAIYAIARSGIGKVYYRMGRLEESEQYLQTALEQGRQLNSAEVQITCRYYLGMMLMDQEHYRKAIREMDQAMELASEFSRRHDIMSIHETLSELYDRMGDIPKAFEHLKSHERLKEDIFQQRAFSKLRNLQVRQQLELAKKEKEVAEQTANLKQQFMANMSHEIRTPMNAIVGMTRLLLEQGPRPDQLRYLNAIRQSADNLLVIINDILDLSKIEAGKVVMEQVPFSVNDILATVRDMLLLKAEEKNLSLILEADNDIPPLIGDPTRIAQILINLAGNSVKFTEQGFVSITAKMMRHADERVRLSLEVTDTGIGIAPDYVEKIFESFTQAGTDVARRFGGTGLGLTICRQLTRLMKGDISVKSELGKGTTFTVILNLPVAGRDELKEAGQDPQASQDLLAMRLKKIRILLVEDNEFNVMVAEDTLRNLLPEATLTIAYNGAQAVEKLTQHMQDVVLMDIQMPVMDGIEATRKIRNELPESIRKVPIVAMTANVLQDDVKKYFEAGMNGYISKPFQPDELLALIDRLLHENPRTETTTVTEKTTAPELLREINGPVTNLAFLKQLTKEDAVKMQKYISMFLENAPRLLARIDDGLANRDLSEVKIAAHSLKPQLSYMGVKEELSMVFLVEQTASEQGHLEGLTKLVHQLKTVCALAFEELRHFTPDGP